MSKQARKKFGRRKVKKESKRALTLLLDFSSPEFSSRLFRHFPAPTNCPWVSEDDSYYDSELLNWATEDMRIDDGISAQTNYRVQKNRVCKCFPPTIAKASII